MKIKTIDFDHKTKKFSNPRLTEMTKHDYEAWLKFKKSYLDKKE